MSKKKLKKKQAKIRERRNSRPYVILLPKGV